MTERRLDGEPRLNPDDLSMEEKQRQLEGRQPPGEQTAYVDQSSVDDLGEISRTDIYQGELEAGVDDDLPQDPDNLELLTERELRDGETDDVMEAVEEGMTYVPPIDPPTVPSDDLQDARIANGFGLSAADQEYGEDDHQSFLPAEDDMEARVREALRADSTTSQYADHVQVVVSGDSVILRGYVTDLLDSDNLVAVASRAEGIADVIDELEVDPMRGA